MNDKPTPPNSGISGKKERNSNLELYRIIVMLAIVAHHYVANSGLVTVLADEPLQARSWFFYFFGMWGKTGINCFVLITGYFMCRSEITLRKFLKLILWIMTYKVILTIAFVATGYIALTPKALMMGLIPFYNLNSGFTGGFIMYWLCIPFLNVMVRHFTQRQHLWCMAWCLLVYALMSKAGMIRLNYVVWFSVLHVIASYIRFYGLSREKDTRFWLFSTFICVVLSLLSVCLFRMTGIRPWAWLVSDSNAPLALLVGITSFMLFKNIQVPQSRLINTVAASTFGVLLIHANSNAMRQWLWKDTLQVPTHFYSDYYVLIALISVIGVFTICTVIDIARARLTEPWLIDKTEKFISNIHARITEKKDG